MVSWDDLPTSSEDDSVTSKPPATIFCEEWSDLVTDLDVGCDHGSVCEKFVAFQDVDSGRRFWACSHRDVRKCNYVQWVDFEWPDALKLILASIWSMHDEETRQMLRQNVLIVEDNLEILREKEKLEDKLRLYKLDFPKVVAEKEHAIGQLGSTQLAMIDLKEEMEQKKMAEKSFTNIHQLIRAKAEKERDQAMQDRDNLVQERDNLVEERDHLKQEKMRLEYMIGDLFKHKEETKDKITELKRILDEID